VLGAGVGRFLDLGFCAIVTARLGECVKDGGEDIGESWVNGGGVLPRKGLRPLDGGLCKDINCVDCGKGGLAEEALLLLRGGAIVSLIGSGEMERASIEGIGTSSCDEWVSFSSSNSPLRGPVAGTTSSSSESVGDGKVGLDLGIRTADNLRFLGFEDEAADEVSIAFDFAKFNGVDSSSGLKSSSSSSSSWFHCGFGAVRIILGSRALFLKFPTCIADPGRAGVPTSISNPKLLDLAAPATPPSTLGCLGRRLKFPIDMIDVFFLRMLVKPSSPARLDSTLLDLACAARPRMLGWRGLLLKFPIESIELSTVVVPLSLRLTSTAGLLDARSISGNEDSSRSIPCAVDSISNCSLGGVLTLTLSLSVLDAAFPLPLFFLTRRTLVTSPSSGSLISYNSLYPALDALDIAGIWTASFAGFWMRGAGADGATLFRFGRGIALLLSGCMEVLR
jgi:hypothetical protein